MKLVCLWFVSSGYGRSCQSTQSLFRKQIYQGQKQLLWMKNKRKVDLQSVGSLSLDVSGVTGNDLFAPWAAVLLVPITLILKKECNFSTTKKSLAIVGVPYLDGNWTDTPFNFEIVSSSPQSIDLRSPCRPDNFSVLNTFALDDIDGWLLVDCVGIGFIWSVQKVHK